MDWTTFAAAILGSSLLSTLVSQLFTWLEKRADKNSGVQEALRLVLKDRLRFLCLRYIEQGWIYEDELEDIVAMHECYHGKLNGNGYLDSLMLKVKTLEIRGIGK